jgi:hypothetical protein
VGQGIDPEFKPQDHTHKKKSQNRKQVRKLLVLISTFSKVREHKINIKTSEAFVYTNNKHAESEIRKVLLVTLSKLHKISRKKPNIRGGR